MSQAQRFRTTPDEDRIERPVSLPGHTVFLVKAFGHCSAPSIGRFSRGMKKFDIVWFTLMRHCYSR
jgi:hypothetical protein